ncbi:Protein kinase domain-containing protein [Forsythia ovata]|uniref:Protein kinase domain-containing protein n=1 Tax=Forsythia ovata TaxID=205694 RepID=A0ABD1X783_9LAMI
MLQVISILGDEKKRAFYDQIGCVDDADLAGDVIQNLQTFFRAMYKKILRLILKKLHKSDFELTGYAYFWVHARAYVRVFKQSFWYMSCNTCKKISSADLNETYECVFCKFSHAVAVPRARVYLELEDSTGSLSGTMIGDTAEKFLQYTGQQLMDSGSQVLEKIRITLEEAQFFYVKGMKKNVLDNEYKYDIIFLNESVPSMSISSTSTRSRSNKGKDVAYTADTPMPLQGQTFPSAVKQLNFPSSPGPKSKKRKIEEHPISSETEHFVRLKFEYDVIFCFSNYSTNFNSSIPQRFGLYSRLWVVDFSDNYLTGRIPPYLCRQSNLMLLNLESNKLYGNIPAGVISCISLQQLRLSMIRAAANDVAFSIQAYGTTDFSLGCDSFNLESLKQIKWEDLNILKKRQRSMASESDVEVTVNENQQPQPKIQIYPTSTGEISSFWREKYERDAKKYRDIFYKRHQDKVSCF